MSSPDELCEAHAESKEAVARLGECTLSEEDLEGHRSRGALRVDPVGDP